MSDNNVYAAEPESAEVAAAGGAAQSPPMISNPDRAPTRDDSGSGQTLIALVFSSVLLLMITVPSIYIGFLSYSFIVGDAAAATPDNAAKFFLNFSSNNSDIFNLFNIIALPTLSAYFGSKSGGKFSLISWIIFIYLLVVFVLSYLPEVAAASTGWKEINKTISINSDAVIQYVKAVRNGIVAAIAVLAGIKLANAEKTR